MGKQTLYAQLDRPEADAYAIAVEVMAALPQSAGAQEGMAAFLEKRAPGLAGLTATAVRSRALQSRLAAACGPWARTSSVRRPEEDPTCESP